MGMPQVAIEFSLLSEFLGPVLTTNQIAKDCTQDTLKKGPIFISCKKCQNSSQSSFFQELENTLFSR